MAGLTGIGRQQAESAIKGMEHDSALEKQREQSNMQLGAAADAKRSSMIGSAGTSAILLAPKAYGALTAAHTVAPVASAAGFAPVAAAPELTEAASLYAAPAATTAATTLEGTGLATIGTGATTAAVDTGAVVAGEALDVRADARSLQLDVTG